MSNKCRGTYTIKGEGTEALVKELNDRVKRFDTGIQDSSGKTIIGADCDITSMLGPKWQGRRVKGDGHLGADGQFVWDYVPEIVYLAGWGNEWPLVIKNGQATFFAETRFAPPVDALTILSDLYPVEITLAYSLECDRWMNGRTLTFHQGKVTQLRYGDFVLAAQGQPINHWVVGCAGKTVNLIKQAGITLLGDDGKEPPPDEAVTVVVRNADIAAVKGLTGVGDCHAYTLDEEGYVLSVQSNLDFGAPRHPHGKDIEIVERPIALLPDEVSTLYGMLVDLARKQAQSPIFEAAPETPVTEVELARFGQYYGDICTCDKVFRPTAREINLLRGVVSEERWKELQDALGKPAWTDRWPDWEDSEWEWVHRSKAEAESNRRIDLAKQCYLNSQLSADRMIAEHGWSEFPQQNLIVLRNEGGKVLGRYKWDGKAMVESDEVPNMKENEK